MKLPKNIDLEILDKTLNLIRKFNDSLRIRFVINENNEISQYVEDFEYKTSRIIYHDSESIFDIIENEKNDILSITGKLNELAIIKTPFNSFVFYKTHHILSDGWGMTQVADQIKELYYMLENGEDISNYTKPSYMDFINREQEYLNSTRFNKDLSFWEEFVKNIEPCTIFKKADNFDKTAKRYERLITEKMCKQIEQFCLENKITEYSFFLAIISIYFYHVYNLNNFAIGTPFLNRQKRLGEFEETGLHVSTLPLHIKLDSDLDFIALCKDINSKNLSLYKHGSFPYYDIQKLFNTAKNISTNLYEIGFSYQINVSERKFKSKFYNENNSSNTGIGECSWLFSGQQNNSITFHLTQLNVKKLFAIDYLTSVFSDSDIERIYDTIFYLIEQVVTAKKADVSNELQKEYHQISILDLQQHLGNTSQTNSQVKISNLQVINSKELSLLKSLNNTGNYTKSNKTVIDYFEEVVQKHPSKTALICDNQNLTYDEFNKKVNILANYLLKNKIKKGTPIVLLFDKSFDMFISLFAVLKIGCHYVPILPDENESRIKYIIEDSKSSCVLTHKNYNNIVKDFEICCYNISEILNTSDFVDNTNNNSFNVNQNEQDSSKNLNTKISPEDLAYMIYTSGSTGNPKGVQVMHKNIIGFIESLKQNTYLKPAFSDISMSLLKYSFDASGIDIYSSLLIGRTLLAVSKNDELNPTKVLELIEKYKVTRCFLIPKWIEHITSTSLTSNYNLSSLKLLGTGGEVLKPNILKAFLEKYNTVKIANLYGPTETTMFTTFKIISNSEIKDNYTSIGKPINYSRIGVINENNMFLPTNCEGELIVYEDNSSINNIAKGYLNLPEQTNKKFINIYSPLSNSIVRAYKTGDIVKINSNLEIEFVGRTDDIVKVNGGYLVALNEVEKRISDLLGENIESYCVAIPLKNTKAIILFVKNDEKSISISNIKKYLKENLSFYMQPKKIIELTQIPRNSSGKVHRQQLKELALKEIQVQTNNLIKPTTNIEFEIYNIIKNLMHLDDFSITDDFLDDLGIDSLALTSICIALNNYNLTMQDFYTYPNTQELARYIENVKILKKSICSLEPEINNIENIKIPSNSVSFDLSTVLITGTTGFLGIHLLHDLLLNKKVKKIYCIVRNKIGIDGLERLKNTVNFYYNSNEKLLSLIDEKVIVLNGDITKPNFNLEKETYYLLQRTVTTLINSAANVKHFAKPEQIKIDNVLSVDYIIDFCKNNISLAHISTLSIAGFKGKHTIDKVYDENTLYINQEFNNNPYLISKFNAEKHIFEAMQNNGLKAKIFRLGNIMPRQTDGKFQQNANQNIFISALKTFLNLKTISNELLNLNIEFSPVDECAKSILSLITDTSSCVYHILNCNEITVEFVIDIFEKLGYKFEKVSHKKFIEKLNTIEDEYVKEYILGTNLNEFSQKKTLNLLKNADFNWSKTTKDYILQIQDEIF